MAVLGAGQMGNGITQVAACAGIQVVMIDIQQEYVDKGIATIEKSLAKLVSKERMSQEDADAARSRISTKSEDEHRAMKRLAPQWLDLFEEYESQETEEAKFVKYLDKLDMALMARIYEDKQGLDLSEFIESARKVIGETNLK